VCLTSDGRTLISSSYDKTIRLWDTARGRFRSKFPCDPGSVYTIELLPNGREILASGYDGLLHLWDLETGKEVRSLVVGEQSAAGNRYSVQAYQVSGDGRTVATSSFCRRGKASGSLVRLWDLPTGKLLPRQFADADAHGPEICLFSPDLRACVGFVEITPASPPAAGKDVPPPGMTHVIVKDLATGHVLQVLPQPDHCIHDYYNYRLAFAPDARTLVTATCRLGLKNDRYCYDQDALHFWELASGKERLKIVYPETGLEYDSVCFAFSPDGRMLAAARRAQTRSLIQLWDVATGRELGRYAGFDSSVTCLRFACDGTSLVSGHADSTILLWDLSEARQHQQGSPIATDDRSLETWWTDLRDADAEKAHTSSWNLVAAPAEAVRIMRQHLAPASSAPADKMRQLVYDLDSNQFARRKAASQQLADLEELAYPALAAALQSNPSVEKRQRIEALLGAPRIVRSPATLQAIRAVEVLEQIGTPDAKQLLTMLAGGAPEARVTQEAKASLERFAMRSR
jgi:hypothetical protein